MNPAMRSRSDCTSGEGLKSIIWTLRHPAVAGEELAPGLEQPGELDFVHVGQRPLEDARSLAARNLRGDREEELVRQPALAQPAVQGGAALAEDRADPALLQEPGERPAEVNALGVADDRHRRGGLGRLLLGCGENHDGPTAGCEEAGVPG